MMRVPSNVSDYFSEEEKLQRWTQIEMYAVEAVVGAEPLEHSGRKGIDVTPTVAQVAKQEELTHHDVAAFVDCLQENCRIIHWPHTDRLHEGLTSSDIVDTALFWTVRDALEEIRKCVRQSDPHWERIDRACKLARVCKISGAVGTGVSIDPRVESYVAQQLGATPIRSTQVIPRDLLAEIVFHCAVISGDPRVRSWVPVSLENVALWHERDISHSSVERIMVEDVLVRTADVVGARMAKEVYGRG